MAKTDIKYQNKNDFDIVKSFFEKRNIEYLEHESLSKRTSVHVGGKAKFFAVPNTQKKLLDLLAFLNENEIKYQILGNGTNLLCLDEGYEGVIICTKKLKRYKVSKTNIYVQCGMGLFEFGKLLRKFELSGLEFMYGIPGSIGGAIVMNAGAFEKNIGEYVEYVLVYQNGKSKKLSREQMKFSYRYSLAQSEQMIVLGAKLNLSKSHAESIAKLQEQYFQKKLASQPYDMPSFGSAFKRNEKLPISKIVDELGLKGYTIGGAQISKKHAGFIVNIGDATCQDYLEMIKYIQQKVFDAYGFVPEPEVRFLE